LREKKNIRFVSLFPGVVISMYGKISLSTFKIKKVKDLENIELVSIE
jgi:hypothetical protein